MSAVPYYQVRIEHSRSPAARTAAAEVGKKIATLTDVRTNVYADERDLWSADTTVVNVGVSYTPFGDDDGAKYERTRAFADRLSGLLGTEVRVHTNDD